MRTSKPYGFTVTELLTVLAIAGILAMLGAPAMGNLLVRSSEASASTTLTNALRHARTAAVMRNARVLMCPSSNGRRCQPGQDWQYGWIVAADNDHDGQPDANVPIIATQVAVTPGTRIITSAGRGALAFQPSGSAAGSNARFTVCNPRSSTGSEVIVANSGRIRLAAAEAQYLRACLDGIK